MAAPCEPAPNRIKLTSGLLATVGWYLAHPGWVDAITGQTGYNQWLEKNYADRGGEK